MFPLGFLTLVSGAWFLDCAIQNRPPLKSIGAIIKNPSGIYSTLGTTKGTGFAPASASIQTLANGTQAFVNPSPGTGSGSAKPTESTNPAVGEAISFARAQIGKPYQWGALGPNAFDCSGLVQQAYKAAGIKLPRTTAMQILVGKKVAKSDLIPGDLVFPDAGHVQLYVGNGQVIEAPRTGEKVRQVAMWGFFTARRVA